MVKFLSQRSNTTEMMLVNIWQQHLQRKIWGSKFILVLTATEGNRPFQILQKLGITCHRAFASLTLFPQASSNKEGILLRVRTDFVIKLALVKHPSLLHQFHTSCKSPGLKLQIVSFIETSQQDFFPTLWHSFCTELCIHTASCNFGMTDSSVSTMAFYFF